MPLAQEKTKMKIRKGDRVIVIAGSDKGKTGEVTKVIPDEQRVIVEGVNLAKKHKRATPMSAGGIETITKPIHVSNVAHIDPKTSKPTRVGYQVKDGVKMRVARKSGEAIANVGGR
jgi:large subunit ribosomal protein L24